VSTTSTLRGRLEGAPGARVRAIVSDAKGEGKSENECELNANACHCMKFYRLRVFICASRLTHLAGAKMVVSPMSAHDGVTTPVMP